MATVVYDIIFPPSQKENSMAVKVRHHKGKWWVFIDHPFLLILAPGPHWRAARVSAGPTVG